MSGASRSTLFELGAGDLQTLMSTGTATCADVVDSCLQRIDARGAPPPSHPPRPAGQHAPAVTAAAAALPLTLSPRLDR